MTQKMHQRGIEDRRDPWVETVKDHMRYAEPSLRRTSPDGEKKSAMISIPHFV